MFRNSRSLSAVARWLRPAVLVWLWALAVPGWADTLRIGGSGGPLSCMPVLLDEFKKTHSDAEISIVGNLGSSGGVKALLAGALDIGLVSRPLNASESARGAVGIEYARTAFVFAVEASVKPAAGAITSRELIGIFRGEITAWPDGQKVRLVLRPESDSSSQVIRAMSMEMSYALTIAQQRRGMLLAVTDQDSTAIVANTPGAIGTATQAQMLCERRNIVALVLDGIVPDTGTIATGKYPFVKRFFFVLGEKPNAVARQFVEFVQSKKGKEVLARHGHWVGPFTTHLPAGK